MIFTDPITRLNHIIELSWYILFEKIVSEKLKINKESSLQLHLSKLIFDLGNIYCILPGENFEIEMETNHQDKSIDIVCILGNVKAAIELKCFMKISNRAKDLDSYDALKDIERLHNFSGFEVRKFICLTDNSYYPKTTLTGHGKSVMLKHGTIYPSNTEIIPGWAGKWKVDRDRPIIFPNDIICNWISKKNWHYWMVDVK
ncbi:hypothetical protein FO440_21545 [Mucilaginibacter corticis]|uniref:Uncharacterized protein n=1 Tax=Mucilaginibacter corticis TaxID=2597670 RepID=A0A556MBP1_9SPHI|nr:hypothetical protein [Mucilaginibacter corticis]TSJ37347.1 hypothetical protein FO440_21545 [Mucilaginibacter corticis]